MTTAIYTRVSSRQQDQRGQLLDLDRWAKQLDQAPLRFEDSASGTTMARDGFGKLMDAVRAGEVTKVVVWRLDRLGRTARGLTELFEEFQALGVTLISLKEGVDLSTPAGRLICNVLASVAQFETEVRGERQRAGIEAAKAQGKKWGGGRNGYWRKLGPAKIAKILKLRSQGLTLKEVSAASEVSVISVRRVIQSQAG